MKVKMKVLSAAAGAALGVSALQAQAEEVLIPYWLSAEGVYTLLDIENFAEPVLDDASGAPLNHRLNYYWMVWDGQQGTPSASDSSGKCVHNDGQGVMSAYDMIFQTVADPADVGGLDLPGAIGDASVPAYYAPNPAQGFLVLDLRVGGEADNPTPEGTLSAHVKILDLVGGIVVGYKALNDETQIGPGGNFGDSPAINHNNFTMSWWPTDWIFTGWFVLATGDGMVNDLNNFWGPGVALISPPDINGVVDNDENFYSGDQRKFFRCMAFVTPDEILTPFQQVNTTNGGFKPTLLVNDTDPYQVANGAVMFRYEITDVGLGTTTWWTHETGGPRTAWPENWAY